MDEVFSLYNKIRKPKPRKVQKFIKNIQLKSKVSPWQNRYSDFKLMLRGSPH